ncbi:4-hydroxythreonine-4-phosphate dehydrogenase [Candidatus Hepatincola sp. Av]
MPQSPSIINKCVALSAGDPNSIAPLITLKAWLQLKDTNQYFVLVSNLKYMEAVLKYYNTTIPLKPVNTMNDVYSSFKEALPIFNINTKPSYVAGVKNYHNSEFVLQSLDTALYITNTNKTCALVTNPVDKSLVNKYCQWANKLPFSGHTEYLAQKTHSLNPVMMMCTPDHNLKVVPLSTHMSLQNAIKSIKPTFIAKKVLIIHQFIQKHYGIKNPKYLFMGLNPHAGDHGLLGYEENQIIIPTLKLLNSYNIRCDGPVAADSAFIGNNMDKYDVIFGMYHDQVLTPFKTLFFDKGVNVTAGLNLIRTSPDHGVAFDIAKTKYANPNSLIAAISMAHRFANSSLFL